MSDLVESQTHTRQTLTTYLKLVHVKLNSDYVGEQVRSDAVPVHSWCTHCAGRLDTHCTLPCGNKGALKGDQIIFMRFRKTEGSSRGNHSGHRMRSSQGGLSARRGRLKVVLCPLGEVSPQVDILGPKSRRWGGAPHRQYGVSAWTHLSKGRCPPLCGHRARHRAVKQGQSGASTGTTDQGKGRVGRQVRIGEAGRQGGERLMGAAAYGGKGFKGRARVSPRGQEAPRSSDKQRGIMPTPPPPSCTSGLHLSVF